MGEVETTTEGWTDYIIYQKVIVYLSFIARTIAAFEFRVQLQCLYLELLKILIALDSDKEARLILSDQQTGGAISLSKFSAIGETASCILKEFHRLYSKKFIGEKFSSTAMWRLEKRASFKWTSKHFPHPQSNSTCSNSRSYKRNKSLLIRTRSQYEP